MVRLDAPPIGSRFPFRNARRHRLSRRSAQLLPHSLLRQGCGLGRRCGGLAAEQRGRGPPQPPVRCGGGSSTPMRHPCARDWAVRGSPAGSAPSTAKWAPSSSAAQRAARRRGRGRRPSRTPTTGAASRPGHTTCPWRPRSTRAAAPAAPHAQDSNPAHLRRRTVPSACSHRAGRGAGGVSAGAGARPSSGRPPATPEGGAAARSRPWAVRRAGASMPPWCAFAVGRAVGRGRLGHEVSLYEDGGGGHCRVLIGLHPQRGRPGAGEPPHRVCRRGLCPLLACSYFQV